MKRLMDYVGPYRWYIALTIFIKFAATTAELFIPRLMQTIIDEKALAGDMVAIFVLGGLMLFCALLSLGGNVLANRMSAISAGRITSRSATSA